MSVTGYGEQAGECMVILTPTASAWLRCFPHVLQVWRSYGQASYWLRGEMSSNALFRRAGDIMQLRLPVDPLHHLVFGVIDIEDDDLGWLRIGRDTWLEPSNTSAKGSAIC